MLDPKLASLLVCPATHQPLIQATCDEVEDLNRAIAAGRLRNVGGRVIWQSLDGALIRKDRQVAYCVRGDIPIMLVEEGFPLSF